MSTAEEFYASPLDLAGDSLGMRCVRAFLLVAASYAQPVATFLTPPSGFDFNIGNFRCQVP